MDVRLDMIPPVQPGTIFPVPAPSQTQAFAPLYGLAPSPAFGFPYDMRQAILGSSPQPYTPGVPGIGGTPVPGAAPGLLTGPFA